MGMTRIISGEARGRKLQVPSEGTRPTSDRAKEGLFSSLQVRFGFQDAVVLDLFAGSGALGLEAASRGAAEVVLVESDPHTCAVIRRNAEVVGHPNVQVMQMVASAYVAQAPRKHFDMVLADPSYDLAPETVVECLRRCGRCWWMGPRWWWSGIGIRRTRSGRLGIRRRRRS